MTISTAKQGHTYEWNSIKVMAMENGPYPVIHAFQPERPWPLRYLGRVNASSLKPLPMAYFGGSVPQ